MQAIVGAIQRHDALLATIIEKDFKSPCRGDNQLMTQLVRVGSARFTAGNIIKVKDAPYLEREVSPPMQRRDIPPGS